MLPSLFSPTILVRYPKISSYPAESLTFRALALLRVVHVIDCVIPFLCSTSPNVDLLTRPMTERPYPLVSFTESSFSSPVSQDVPVGHVDLHSDHEGKLVDYSTGQMCSKCIQSIEKPSLKRPSNICSRP